MEISKILPEHSTDIYHLAEEIKAVWGIRILIGGLSLSILLFFIDLNTPSISILFPSFSALLGIALTIIAAIVLPPLYWRFWKFLILDDEIIIQHGILIRTIAFVPTVRIQHLEVKRGIWERLFGLATLKIYTAGTRQSDVKIPGLPAEYALQLREYLQSKLEKEDVI